MPSDLLMPAFALTLVANAILIVVALRALLRGPDRADHRPPPTPPGDRSRATPAAAPPTPRPAPVPAPPADPEITPVPGADDAVVASEPIAPVVVAPAPVVVAAPEPEPAELAAAATAALPELPLDPPPGPDQKPPKRPTRVKTASRPAAATVTVAGAAAASATPKGQTAARPARRRQKFALPPLDDDHEKVNRSIETFLAGGENAADGVEPTTIALVSLAGPAGVRIVRSPTLGETVERELRGAARATDRVEAIGTDRWRVTLAATGELAARAYLRGVRAAVEPGLADLDPAIRLVAATATAPGDSLDEAEAAAARRLAALLGTDVTDGDLDPDEDAEEPLVSGD